jgi:hypothetical protein
MDLGTVTLSEPASATRMPGWHGEAVPEKAGR